MKTEAAISHQGQLNDQFESVSRAFTEQSKYFDGYESNNLLLTYMRNQVRSHVDRFIKPGDQMLELNAGTGLDAVYFANKGIRVCATDLSVGMISEIEKKVFSLNLSDQIKAIQCSFTDLQIPEFFKADYIFSNFGGLNCVEQLSAVFGAFPGLLNQGGFVTLVVMPRICPWELIHVVKGNFRFAFRRLQKNGALAHLEGHYFNTYYHPLGKVRKALGKDFKLIQVEGLGALIPPPSKDNFPVDHPRIYSVLEYLDRKLRLHFPFNQWADHFIATFRYQPRQDA